jgi:lysophospholipase L1-like esterase
MGKFGMQKISVISLAFVLLTVTGLSAADSEPKAETKPKQVLIIGDSISFGYLKDAKEQLTDVAQVTHNKGNAKFTTYGLKQIDKWIGDKKWDLIQFNWGLWDMYGWSQNPKLTVKQYEKQLDTLTARLKKTGTKLIFVTTTPVCPAPERTAKIIVSQETANSFAAAAARVMAKYKIPVNDLHAVIAVDRAKYAKGDNDVHYNNEGRRVLGTQVAKAIKQQLGAKAGAADKADGIR